MKFELLFMSSMEAFTGTYEYTIIVLLVLCHINLCTLVMVHYCLAQINFDLSCHRDPCECIRGWIGK